MIKKSAFILLMLFTVSKATAVKTKGYYVDQTNDTNWVTLDVPMGPLNSGPQYEFMNFRIKGWDKVQKRIKLKPSMAKEIVFFFNDTRIRLISTFNRAEFAQISYLYDMFVILDRDGPLKLYRYYVSSNANTFPTARIATRMLQKEGQPILIMRSDFIKSTFTKEFPEYFKECNYIIEQHKKRKYNCDNLNVIVDDYVNHCE